MCIAAAETMLISRERLILVYGDQPTSTHLENQKDGIRSSDLSDLQSALPALFGLAQVIVHFQQRKYLRQFGSHLENPS